MGGLSAVTARILRYHEGRAPDLLERKYAAMAATPFAFYRGSCQLFVDAWPSRTALNDTPAIWSCGDLHFENLGCYKGDNRLAYFDLNDFDEAALLPIAWDLTRFAASVLVGAPQLRVSAGDAADLAKLYLRLVRGHAREGKGALARARNGDRDGARTARHGARRESGRRCLASAPN